MKLLEGTAGLFPLFAVIFLGLAGVAADCLLKRAGSETSCLNGWLLLGALAYALTALGWVYAFRHFTLAQAGVIYCVVTVLLLAGAGVVFFRETLRPVEVLGVALALASVCLLSRFAK